MLEVIKSSNKYNYLLALREHVRVRQLRAILIPYKDAKKVEALVVSIVSSVYYNKLTIVP